MSDPKRATLITVGATKSEKNKVNKTVRLTINLVESNESKYPELNYKELVIAEDRKHKTSIENGKNGKTNEGLNPFSDNDDDVERVARKFEQKYGGKSTYGRKGRSKHDDFADIGAGYDENDSFIDNTDGYDEMIPPECDTLYGGFYINSGSLEFKNVDPPPSDEEPRGRRNKRRISSSSSEEESSDSSSESEGSNEMKEPKTVVNGAVDSHDTQHRKKKNKNTDKKKAKKIRRTDSSAATSGKQTSDDNVHGDGESADSRTSQSDSLTSKPAPSSENPITSDSSRDAEAKVEPKLPAQVITVLEELESIVSRHLVEKPTASHKEIEAAAEPYVVRLERSLCSLSAAARVRGLAWTRAARSLHVSRTKLLQRVRALVANTPSTASTSNTAGTAPAAPTNASSTTNTHNSSTSHHKRKADQDLEDIDTNTLTDQEREDKIVETIQRLKALIDERKPGMMANYNAECERVQEERKKIQIASAAEGVPAAESTKRLPKRRFPWCPRSRALLGRLVKLANNQEAAAYLLAKRVLPLFPNGFVRMPTLLRQADLSKEIKVSDIKRQRTGAGAALPPAPPAPPGPLPPALPDEIHFPSTLTVTTMNAADTSEAAVGTDDKDNQTIFGSILNSFSLSKDLVVEKQDEKKKETEKKEDLYIPSNNIGSITITPVSNQKPEKKINHVSDKQKPEGLIRVKSPAALNEMVNQHKQEKNKALENIHKRDKDKHRKDKHEHKKDKHDKHSNDKTHTEKRVDSPLHIDTSYQGKKEPTPSPKTKEEISRRHIESMRIAESNIPRPALIPVHHSPTFAKPDKRPPEKKKKDVLIVSDVDPLSDVQTESVVAVDDSSSDVELVEEKSEKSDKSESVPFKDKVSAHENHKKDSRSGEKRTEEMDEATKEDFDSVMKNLRDLEHSREAPNLNSSSYGGVITSAKREKSSSQFHSRSTIFVDPRADKDKLDEGSRISKPAPQPLVRGESTRRRRLRARRQETKVLPKEDQIKKTKTNFFEQNGWM